MHLSAVVSSTVAIALFAFVSGFALSVKSINVFRGLSLRNGRFALSADIALWTLAAVSLWHYQHFVAAQVCLAFVFLHLGVAAGFVVGRKAAYKYLQSLNF